VRTSTLKLSFLQEMEPNVKAAELCFSLSLDRLIICFENYDVILKITD
jgi:hypothetical protein